MGWEEVRRAETWREIGETAANDVRMLRTELVVGYLIAGFAAALIPNTWLSGALQLIGTVRSSATWSCSRPGLRSRW